MPFPSCLFFKQLFDGANPAFVLTVFMHRSRRVFRTTVLLYVALAAAVFLYYILLPSGGSMAGREAFFEIGLLAAAGLSLVFLGSDYGVVFIESTFQDELFRLTPLSPLQIVHGGMQAGLFFSVLLLLLTLPVYPLGAVLGFPLLRIFFGTLSLFLLGQCFSMILISCYITARNWSEIGFGTVTVLLLFFLVVGFCFTPLGRLLIEPVQWPLPILFLDGVFVAFYLAAYLLARNHALRPRRTLFAANAMNVCVFGPVFLFSILAAFALSRFV